MGIKKEKGKENKYRVSRFNEIPLHLGKPFICCILSKSRRSIP
jgi:hypothetical protein